MPCHTFGPKAFHNDENRKPEYTKMLRFGGRSLSRKGLPLDLTLSLSPPLRNLLAVPSSVSVCGGSSGWKKRGRGVVFADSKGLPLTTVHYFEREEAPSPPTKLVRLQGVGILSQGRARETTTLGRRGWWLRLGFPQPSSDYLSFLVRLDQDLVQLESCRVTAQALSGTVRVRNVSLEKAVGVRVTFDSWRSHCDMPCTFLQAQSGGDDTDAFAFEVPLPVGLDPRERLEFCISYRPGDSATTFWDNNKGQNYRVCFCPKPEVPLICCAPVRGLLHKGLKTVLARRMVHRLDFTRGHSSETMFSQNWDRLDYTAPSW